MGWISIKEWFCPHYSTASKMWREGNCVRRQTVCLECGKGISKPASADEEKAIHDMLREIAEDGK